MRIGVVGINHKLADLKTRELLAKACQRRFGPSASAHGSHSFILLSTCNRTEIYFSSHDLTASHSYLLSILRNEVDIEFDQKLYSYFGSDCFLHLARVTAGLDSAIVAETEIQGQVKTAYESASEYVSLPGPLHYLFQKSLKIGKEVRSTLPLQRGLPDLQDAVLNKGFNLFHKPQEARILFVGASDINLKVIRFFKAKNMADLTICNRSKASGTAIANELQIDCLDWAFISDWHKFDWIIFGTKAEDHLIALQDIPKEPIGRKLIIDLSVPRNVDPELSKHPQISLLNIDQINRSLKVRQRQMMESLIQAEQIVAKAIELHTSLFRRKTETHVQQLLAAV